MRARACSTGGAHKDRLPLMHRLPLMPRLALQHRPAPRAHLRPDAERRLAQCAHLQHK